MYNIISISTVLLIISTNLRNVESAFASKNAINSIKDNLTLASIIPTTLNSFTPTGILTISFGLNLKSPSIGRQLDKSSVTQVPDISFTPVKGITLSNEDRYLVVMMDVDASILHYVSTNLSLSSTSFRNGSFPLSSPSTPAILCYLPPSPPLTSITPHKYLVLFYLQPKNFNLQNMNLSRTGFKVLNFMKTNELNGRLKSVTFFKGGSGKDSSSSTTSGGGGGGGGGGGSEMIGKGLNNPIDDSGFGKGIIKKSMGEKLSISDTGLVFVFIVLIGMLM